MDGAPRTFVIGGRPPGMAVVGPEPDRGSTWRMELRQRLHIIDLATGPAQASRSRGGGGRHRPRRPTGKPLHRPSLAGAVEVVDPATRSVASHHQVGVTPREGRHRSVRHSVLVRERRRGGGPSFGDDAWDGCRSGDEEASSSVKTEAAIAARAA